MNVTERPKTTATYETTATATEEWFTSSFWYETTSDHTDPVSTDQWEFTSTISDSTTASYMSENVTHLNVSATSPGKVASVATCLSKEDYFICILLLLIFSSGILLNSTLLYAIVRERLYRFSNNLCIVNLAIADLMILMTDVLLAFMKYALPSMKLSYTVSFTIAVIQNIAAPASVLTLAVMSCDRHHAIKSSTMRKSKDRRDFSVRNCLMSKTGLAVIGVWVYSILSVVPLLQLAKTEYIKFSLALVIGCTITYVFPMLVIGFNYFAIAVRLFSLAESMKVGARRNAAMRRSRARALSRAKSLLILAIVFLSCSFPRHFLIWANFFFPGAVKQNQKFWDIWGTCGFYLYYLYPILNPLSLYSTSEQFRFIYDRYLFRCNLRPAGFEEQSSSKGTGGKSTGTTGTDNAMYS